MAAKPYRTSRSPGHTSPGPHLTGPHLSGPHLSGSHLTGLCTLSHAMRLLIGAPGVNPPFTHAAHSVAACKLRSFELMAIWRLFVLTVLLALLWLPPQTGLAGSQRSFADVDRIVVTKSSRTLQLFRGSDLVASFRVALGREPRGHKTHEGDGRTPEGLYWLDNWKEDSRFHKAIRISYPNRADRARARSLGKPAGGAIMLHGLPKELMSWGPDHYLFNWTEGCIAVTNEEMDLIWNSVRPGTPIEIQP